MVISLNNPIFAKMYTEILCEKYYLEIRTNLIYDIWKKNLLDNETLVFALDIIMKNDTDKTSKVQYAKYFEKQVEMLKELRDKGLVNKMIKKAIENYSKIFNYYTDDLIYLQSAIELMVSHELQSKIKSFFQKYYSINSYNIQEQCKLAPKF